VRVPVPGANEGQDHVVPRLINKLRSVAIRLTPRRLATRRASALWSEKIVAGSLCVLPGGPAANRNGRTGAIPPQFLLQEEHATATPVASGGQKSKTARCRLVLAAR